MYFELSIVICRPPLDVFIFFRDKDQIRQKEKSPVLLIEKTTAGPPNIGTRYREVVQMLPFIRGEILSEITRYEPVQFLEENFEGAGMKGHLAYQLIPEGKGTKLIQREDLLVGGFLKPFEKLIAHLLYKQLQERLAGIKVFLESG
jgi:hypothetical protein